MKLKMSLSPLFSHMYSERRLGANLAKATQGNLRSLRPAQVDQYRVTARAASPRVVVVDRSVLVITRRQLVRGRLCKVRDRLRNGVARHLVAVVLAKVYWWRHERLAGCNTDRTDGSVDTRLHILNPGSPPLAASVGIKPPHAEAIVDLRVDRVCQVTTVAAPLATEHAAVGTTGSVRVPEREDSGVTLAPIEASAVRLEAHVAALVRRRCEPPHHRPVRRRCLLRDLHPLVDVPEPGRATEVPEDVDVSVLVLRCMCQR